MAGQATDVTTRRKNLNRLCAAIGISSGPLFLVLKVVANQFAVAQLNWLAGKLGWIQAFFAAFVVGFSFYAVLKVLYFFWYSGFSPSITVWHYILKVWRDRHLWLYALTALIFVAVMVVAIPTIGEAHTDHMALLNYAILFGVSLVLLSFLAHFRSLRFGQRSLGVLEYHICDLCYPGARKRHAAVGDSNKEMKERLLRCHNQDVICIASIHFSHLLQDDPDALKTIRANNPRAEIYCMLQFPYAWHIRERAAELDYQHGAEYVDRLVASVVNARNILGASVRLRHYPALFRMAIWARFKRDKDTGKKRVDQPTCKIPLKAWSGAIESGGAIIQVYSRGRDGYESPTMEINTTKWQEALVKMLEWFFVQEWPQTSPVVYADLCGEPQAAAQVGRSLHFVRAGKIDRLGQRDGLVHYLSEHSDLKDFYQRIERDLS